MLFRSAPVQAEEPKAPAESEYTIEELADGAGNIFKVQREWQFNRVRKTRQISAGVLTHGKDI